MKFRKGDIEIELTPGCRVRFDIEMTVLGPATATSQADAESIITSVVQPLHDVEAELARVQAEKERQERRENKVPIMEDFYDYVKAQPKPYYMTEFKLVMGVLNLTEQETYALMSTGSIPVFHRPGEQAKAKAELKKLRAENPGAASALEAQWKADHQTRDSFRGRMHRNIKAALELLGSPRSPFEVERIRKMEAGVPGRAQDPWLHSDAVLYRIDVKGVR